MGCRESKAQETGKAVHLAKPPLPASTPATTSAAQKPPPGTEPVPKDDAGRQQPQASEAFEGMVVLRVLGAELNRSFDYFGKMDPFAVVEWTTADGSTCEVSRTMPHNAGHMTPTWDHTCRGQLYNRGDRVSVQVMDKDFVSDELCGTASVLVSDLLGAAAEAAASGEMTARRSATVAGPIQQLSLKLGTETTGTVSIQALLLSRQKMGEQDQVEMRFTRVAAGTFEAAVTRMGVSGGTAPFFNLKLKSPAPGQSTNHYLGKDLSHAADEVCFYEEAMGVLRNERDDGLANVLQFTFEYLGVQEVRTEEQDRTEKPKELLVMRNLRDGYTKLRMLDIKMGQKTAQAGWQGKSRLHALKQSVVDGYTNSACEGFRLEGFDSRPPALASMDPMLDLGMSEGNNITKSEKVRKKVERIMLQRLTAAEIFMHFIDVHQEPADPGEAELQKVLSPIEVVEIVLHEIVRRLAALAIACRKAPVPQKWIGSSVALGFECGKLPERLPGTEAALRKAAHVKIFDWGRSELNTIDKHMTLSPQEQRDRALYWKNYTGGVDRLSWEAARTYQLRFGKKGAWVEVTFTVNDFDSMTANDFIGTAKVRVEETPQRTVGIGGLATLTYSIAWRALPKGSRLNGVWRVHVVRADKLVSKDISLMRHAKSDPFCEVVARAEDGTCFRQVTCVKVRTLDPDWDEFFELPEPAKLGELEVALDILDPGLQAQAAEPAELQDGKGGSPGRVRLKTRSREGLSSLSASSDSRCEIEHPEPYVAQWQAWLDEGQANQTVNTALPVLDSPRRVQPSTIRQGDSREPQVTLIEGQQLNTCFPACGMW